MLPTWCNLVNCILIVHVYFWIVQCALLFFLINSAKQQTVILEYYFICGRISELIYYWPFRSISSFVLLSVCYRELINDRPWKVSESGGQTHVLPLLPITATNRSPPHAVKRRRLKTGLGRYEPPVGVWVERSPGRHCQQLWWQNAPQLICASKSVKQQSLTSLEKWGQLNTLDLYFRGLWVASAQCMMYINMRCDTTHMTYAWYYIL